MKTNYSVLTSLPPFVEGQQRHKTQEEKIFQAIANGTDCLLKLAELFGLPQSTISARSNQLIDEGRVEYFGTVKYKNRLRKKLRTVSKQTELF